MGRIKSFERPVVLNQAMTLFWRKGFADTSLQDIESATGLNKSSLYREFKDKEDLFQECLTKYMSDSPAVAALNREPLGLHNVFAALTEVDECDEARGCFVANTIRESAIVPKRIRSQILEFLSHLHDLVVLNLVHEGIEKKRAQQIAEMILTMNAGLSLRANIQEIKDRKEFVKNFFVALGLKLK